MATKGQGQVTLRGRFSPGSEVRLVKVRDASVLRAEGGEDVGSETVDSDGRVQFKGVEVDARYFVVGYVDGFPLEVRVRGRSADDDSEVLSQPPIAPDRVRLGDGSWSDEAPKKVETPGSEVAPAPSLAQVAEGVALRSDTSRGSAHPVAAGESVRQEDAEGPQMSDTATGTAAPIIQSLPPRQEDVPDGTPQRSDTKTGVATPLPAGDAVEAQRSKESATARAARGEPVKAAAVPLEADAPKSAKKADKKK